MNVVISPNLTRIQDTIDFATGKKIRKIFYPNGKKEVWELDGAGNQTKQIQ